MSEAHTSSDHVTVVPAELYDEMMKDEDVVDPNDVLREASMRAREVVQRQQYSLF